MSSFANPVAASSPSLAADTLRSVLLVTARLLATCSSASCFSFVQLLMPRCCKCTVIKQMCLACRAC